MRYRIRCTDCRWVGVRTARDCECYDTPCHPLAPGAGCPGGINGPCPRCTNRRFTGWPVTARAAA